MLIRLLLVSYVVTTSLVVGVPNPTFVLIQVYIAGLCVGMLLGTLRGLCWCGIGQDRQCWVMVRIRVLVREPNGFRYEACPSGFVNARAVGLQGKWKTVDWFVLDPTVPREDHAGSFPDEALCLHQSVRDARREVQRAGVLGQAVLKLGREQIIFVFVPAECSLQQRVVPACLLSLGHLRDSSSQLSDHVQKCCGLGSWFVVLLGSLSLV